MITVINCTHPELRLLQAWVKYLEHDDPELGNMVPVNVKEVIQTVKSNKLSVSLSNCLESLDEQGYVIKEVKIAEAPGDQNNDIILHELVGDWSQEISLCSYNDDWVLNSILAKTINAEFAEATEGDTARKNLERMYPDITDWQSLFDDLLAKYKCWPSGWGSYVPFNELPENYGRIIEQHGREDLYELKPESIDGK